MSKTPAPKERPRKPSGARPYDLGEPQAERVLSITMALASEVAVLHERLDTLARVASDKPRFSLADLEAYEPSPEVRAEREAWRRAYIKRLLRIMHEAEPNAGDAADYAAFVKDIS